MKYSGTCSFTLSFFSHLIAQGLGAYNNYIFNLIDIYIYIPANGCIGSRLGVLLCPGSYNAVKTALSRLAVPRFTKHIQNNVTVKLYFELKYL
jgi:hypothetical protein